VCHAPLQNSVSRFSQALPPFLRTLARLSSLEPVVSHDDS
jgi:hypothetical protein